MQDFWAGALGLAVLLYIILDGFDLGIGILFPFAPGEPGRRHMMDAVSPVWDGNETWLVIAGGGLFGTFPLAYSILLGALYFPLIVMLCGLILRGVAFEFRHRASGAMQAVWSTSFWFGSLVAAFAQGNAVGAFVQELPVHNGVYVGGLFGWFSPFTALCGVGLCLGYSMLGATWLTAKTHGDVRAFGYRVLPAILAGLGLFLVAATIYAFAAGFPITHQWLARPILLVAPSVALLAGLMLVRAVLRRRDGWTYPMAVVIFICAFATMVGSVVPYLVPFSITIQQAAAPHASLAFLFWGAGIIVLPVTLIYTGVVYYIFRGKVQPSSHPSE